MALAAPSTDTNPAPKAAHGAIPGDIPADLDGRLTRGAEAVQSGDLGLAAACFAGAHELQPDNTQVLSNLVTVRNARDDLKGAERALQHLADLAPDDATVHYQLGMLKGRRGDSPGACDEMARAIALDPDNAAYRTAYAIWSQDIVDRFHDVPGLLNAAAALDTDGAKLAEIADVLVYRQHYADAVRHLKTLETLKGGLDLVQLRLLAVALKEQGQDDEARHVFNAAISVCDRLIGETWLAPTTLDRIPADIRPRVMDLLALSARLYHNAGDADAAHKIYTAMGTAAGRKLSYGGAYWPDTADRVARLRAMMQGRDAVLLCHGHSIGDFAARIGDMAGRDACFVGIDRFGALETEVLLPAGRRLELTLSLTPDSIRKQSDDFVDFLARDDTNMAFASLNALQAAYTPEERDDLAARFGDKLIAVANDTLRSVTPDDPLGVIQENALLAALPLIVAGAPRRVFLLGTDRFRAPEKADSVAPRDDGQSLENFDRTMIDDARICDRDAAFQVMAMAALHGFAEPRVYNVSPHSRLQAFEKIDLDRFFDIVGRKGED